VKLASRGVLVALAQNQPRIAERWLQQTLAGYPGQGTHFLLQEKNPFRNPVGQTFREGLPALLAELAGEMNPARLRAALDGMVRIRAVQDFSASQALAFLFLLKKVLREELPEEICSDAEGMSQLEDRIDQLALLAFDLFSECRAQLSEIKLREARRRVYLPEQMHLAKQGGGS
jgi:hypothetical protein